MNGPAPSVVVIGYGNRLRGDDAVGQHAAEIVAGWQWPHVQVLAVAQLTPELVEPLARADLAIFVDARAATDGGGVEAQQLEAAAALPALGHSSSPQGLLALTQALHGRTPRAWWLTVPATDFAFHDELSATAQCGLQAALRRIAQLVGHAAP